MKVCVLIIITILSCIAISSQTLPNVENDSINQDIRFKILEGFKSGSKKDMFKVYHFLFKKEYDLNSQEALQRYKNFKKTVSFIEETNSKNLSYKLAINQFSDLSDEEFRKTYLNVNIEKETMNFLSDLSYFDTHVKDDEDDGDDDIHVEAPAVNFDWNGSFSETKDQGACGSCWAFSTIGAIEGNYFNKFGQKLRFAEQQLVDCSNYTNGCSGSDPKNALKYILENGIAFENSYKYISGLTSSKENCMAPSLTMNKVVAGSKFCSSSKCTRATIRSYVTEGPTVVLIDGEGNGIFKSYKSGIIDMPCTNANHAVILTGYGTDATGREYYSGRNSWAKSWGENGFFKIYVRDSDNSCFMETYGLLPLVNSTPNPEPPKPLPTCLKLYSENFLKGTVLEACNSFSSLPIVPKSFDIGKFTSIRLYAQTKCTGTFYPLDKSIGSFSQSGITMVLQSLFIDDGLLPPQGCIWAYDDYCFSGNKIQICASSSDLEKDFKFANKISSIKFGPGISKITAYTSINFYGSYSSSSSSRISYSGSSLDKKIVAIKLNC